MAKLLNKCPLCGGKLTYNALMQYAYVYPIKTNGAMSLRGRKEDIGPMECGFISCVNGDFVTNCDLGCEEHPNIKIWQEHDQYFYDDESE